MLYKTPAHYDKIKRHDAWEDLAKEIGFKVTVDECKKKLNCVLSAMIQEKVKIKKSFGKGKGKEKYM